jgi:hypothetical protein
MKILTKLFLMFLVFCCGNAIAQSDQKSLLGEWVGKLKISDTASLNIVFRYEIDKDGKPVAFLDSPDQGAKNIPITDVAVEGNQVSFKVPAVQGQYKGQFTEAGLSGKWEQAGREVPLDFIKGKYQAAENRVDISPDVMQQLLGRWAGKVGPLTVVVRFEQNDVGKYVVLMDSPDQGAKGIPVAKAAVMDDTLSLSVPAVGGEYSGKLSGDTIVGNWTQLGNSTPLILAKQQVDASPE